jgi:3-oxoacyl-[acyl-carrier protein] reductase
LHNFKNKEPLLRFREEFGDTCQPVSVDFNDMEQLDRFVQKRHDIDILINAAAVTRAELLPVLKESDITRMLNVNILAAVKLCRAVIPGMVSRRRGIIVNISSAAALRGNRGQSVYAGTKGFIESFTRSMAAEYGGRGIRVNAVAPGAIAAGSMKELLAYGEKEVKESVVSNRLGTPGDVAAVVAFLCSENASFINGKSIGVDGGFCRGV